MGEKKLDQAAQYDPGLARELLIHEWTRVEEPQRERIRLRWPRLGRLLDALAAAS